MAPVLCAQSSVSTNDEDDFCSSYESHKGEYSTGSTSIGCVSSYCHSPEINIGVSQRRIYFGVEKVLSAVYNAICELYNEDILPTLHEIRRKIQRNSSNLVDGNWLLRICREDLYRRFDVVNISHVDEHHTDKGIQHSWAIMLAGKPFVQREVNPSDPRELADLFRHAVFMASANMSDRPVTTQKHDVNISHDIRNVGGRYLFADHLRKTGPERFRSLPLGKVVRIVQDALDSKILSYDGNNVVPVVSSMSTANKIISRMQMMRANSSKLVESQIRTMRENIITILSEKPRNSNESSRKVTNGPKGGYTVKLKSSDNPMSLCKLPLAYKKRFNIDIDFASVGYSKLIDFLIQEVPECILEPSIDFSRKTNNVTKGFGSLIVNIGYQPSTNILFPLAMNASRLSDNAAIRLVTEW
uniref:HTH OST-type domain-containing protein n=1 Tax=Babesia bovis TaxID=5865 RepID=A0A142BWN5_BABBO|nr:hypothetical protein BBOV_III010230 [Babesia bovis]